jgi:hypothetical protein
LFASLVLLMATAKKKPWKTSTSSRHITNLEQSILETFDIYGQNKIRINPICVGSPKVVKANKATLAVEGSFANNYRQRKRAFINFFSSSLTAERNKLECLSLKSDKHWPVCVRTYPYSGRCRVLHSGRLQPYPQTIYKD